MVEAQAARPNPDSVAGKHRRDGHRDGSSAGVSAFPATGSEAADRVALSDREGEDGLFGDSLGGLFALYVLFHAPETFNRYIVGSPSLWWDDRVVFDYADQYAAAASDLDARVFISVGSLEENDRDEQSRRSAMVSNVSALADRLRSRGYRSFQITTQVLEGETHLPVVPVNLSRGIRALYRPKGRDER